MSPRRGRGLSRPARVMVLAASLASAAGAPPASAADRALGEEVPPPHAVGSAADPAHRRVVEASRLLVAPKIDGSLDDAAWNRAAKIEGFSQWAPSEGARATERTVAYLGYDEAHLYLAFQASDSEPSLIRSSLSQREQIAEDDLVWVSLDPFNARRIGYEFICNPLGVQWDVFMTPSSWDPSFDTVWHCAGRRTPGGFVVEMAIPFRSLRFAKKGVQDWGLQLHRLIRRKNEHVSWSPVFADRGHYFYQMGLLQGLQGLRSGENLAIVPEATAFKSPGFHWGNNVGVSVKYKPSPHWAFDGAFKPDFSQIELDPVRPLTNLRFPVFIAEKRPFYMERADVFTTPISVVNTRSIVTPYWGVKAAGKIQGANLGLLYSRDRAPAREADVYAARANFDVGADHTLGVIATEREQGPAFNRVAGVDGRLRWSEVYSASLQAAGSGDSKTDGAAPRGKALYAQLARNTRALEASASYTDIDPSFHADVGFIPRADIRNLAGGANCYFYPEKPWLTRWGPQLAYGRIYTHTGVLTDELRSASLYFEAPRWYWSVTAQPENLERFEGRGFRRSAVSWGLGGAPTGYVNGALAGTLGQALHYTEPVELGVLSSFSGSINLKPLSWLRLESALFESLLRQRGSGAVLSEQSTWRETARLQLSRELSFRAIADWTRLVAVPPPSSRILTLSFLSSYLLSPGTALHAGLAHIRQRDDDGPWRLQEQTLFLKASYLFVY